METEVKIYISGMGIVFHSGGVGSAIKEGEDYFNKEYSEPEMVAEHVKKGDMVGFCTGSGGNYILRFREGYPDEQLINKYPLGARLAIVIDDGNLYIRDLFDLLDWRKECDKKISLDNGIYHITLNTAIPSTGYYGDNQVIYVYLQKLQEMPLLAWTGVPQLCE